MIRLFVGIMLCTRYKANCFAPLEKGHADAIRNRHARDVVLR